MTTISTTPVALITGGARGIGLACAVRLLADAFCVGVVEVNERAMLSARERLSTNRGRVQLFAASVTDRPAMTDVIDALRSRWGRVDVLVNNAAINRAGGLLAPSDADWEAVLAVNLTGAIITSAVAAAAMRERGGGSIITIGSIRSARRAWVHLDVKRET